MGISRDSRHKRAATGAKRAYYRKKRSVSSLRTPQFLGLSTPFSLPLSPSQTTTTTTILTPPSHRAFEKGRQPANTRLGNKRIHLVRTRGGNKKFRALRLDSGNFSWGSEGVARKTRIIVVAYHPSNNELVRTNTLTKSAVVQIDAAPFRQWYEAHYGATVGRRRQARGGAGGQQGGAAAEEEKKKSKSIEKKQAARLQEMGKVETALERQFEAGRLYAVVSSRPGQSGRCDGYVLEGEELAFYQRAIRK